MGQEKMEPGRVSRDRIFLSVLVTSLSGVKVQIGEHAPTMLRAFVPGINHFSVPFNGQTGPVRMIIMRDGQEITTAIGPAITGECNYGMVDWNAVVGSSDDCP